MMIRSYRRLFLLLVLVLHACCPLAAEARVDAETATKTRFALPERADAVLIKIADGFLKQTRNIAGHLNAEKYVRLQIQTSFYDKNLRRLFVAFEGAATFTGRLTSRIETDDRYFTSDGEFAWDLTVDRITVRDNAVSFRFRGDVVVFLDRVLCGLVEEMIDLTGGIAFASAADTMIAFLEKFNGKLFAEAISRTLATFSKKSLSTSGAVLAANAIEHKNLKLSALIRQAVDDGSLVSFFCFTVIRASLGTASGMVGSSLGAAVGSSLCPGPGTVVGAFLGRRLTVAVAHSVSYKLTTALPVDHCLKKIRRYAGLLARYPGDPEASSRIVRLEQFIIARVQREMDENVYVTFDRVLEKILAFDRADHAAFVSLLRKMREMLTFKLHQKGDWYAAKKYYQMRQAWEGTGLGSAIGF